LQAKCRSLASLGMTSRVIPRSEAARNPHFRLSNSRSFVASLLRMTIEDPCGKRFRGK